MKPEIGSYRLIPAETEVWSIDLQHTVKFVKDIVVKIYHTAYNNDEYASGKIQLVLFNHPGAIPGIDDTRNEIDFTFSESQPWKLPEPQLDFTYNDRT